MPRKPLAKQQRYRVMVNLTHDQYGRLMRYLDSTGEKHAAGVRRLLMEALDAAEGKR